MRSVHNLIEQQKKKLKGAYYIVKCLQLMKGLK